MFTLRQAVGAGTSALDGLNADSSTGVSAGQAADDNKKGMPVVKVEETDGIVTATLGTVGTKGIANSAVTTDKINNSAVTTDKLNDSAVTSAKIADGAVTMAKTNFTVKQATSGDVPAHLAGGDKYYGDFTVLRNRENNIKSWATATNSETDADERKLYELRNANKLDDAIPTIAAVEARVQEVANSASNAVTNLDVGLTSGTTGQTMGGTAVTADQGKVIVSIQEQDGLLTNVALGQAGTAGIADSAVTTAKINNGAVTTDKLNDDAVTSAKIANGTIVNADINASAAIDFTKMDSGLSSVNVQGGDFHSSCTAANPCVLSYFDGHYEWTQMDTEGVSAVN